MTNSGKEKKGKRARRVSRSTPVPATGGAGGKRVHRLRYNPPMKIGGRLAQIVVRLGLAQVLISLAIAALPARSLATQQANAAASPQSGEVSRQENVPYARVNGQELRLDIYEPSLRGANQYPAVVLIHGGSWSNLDKSTMRTMGQFLARAGFVAFSVDYRLLKDGENRWPAQLDDVQRAVRWVRANAVKYGANPDRMGAFGHSAGAQLAALLGMEDTRDNSDAELAKFSSRVQAVVDVSGPTDFTTEHDPQALAFLGNFFGGDFASHADTWRQASPALNVSKGCAPFLIVHGTHDERVPIAQAQELFDKLQAAGITSSFVKVDDAHTFQTPEARRRLAFETLEFFQRYLVARPAN